MKKIFLLLILVLFTCNNAYADLVYTTTNGYLGSIDYESIDELTTYPNQFQTGTSPIVTSYLLNGYAKVMLINPLNTLSDWDQFYVFDGANLTTPENTDDLFFNGISGTTSIVTAVNADVTSVFLTSNQGVVAEYRAGETEPRNYYNYSDVTSDDAVALKSLISRERLFVLFDRHNEYLNQDIHELLRFDGMLKKNSSFASLDLGVAANDVAVMSNGMVFAGFDGGIRKISNKEYEDLLTEDNVTNIHVENKKSFYTISKNATNNTTTLSYYYEDEPKVIYSGTTGECNTQLLYDSKNKLLAAILCDGILVLDISDSTIEVSRFIPSSELGGIPNSVAFLGVSTITSNTSSSSSSGCNAISMPFMGILLAGLIAKFKK